MVNRRFITLLIAAILANPFPGNFFKGEIYQGRLKGGCLPVLNCYSCPAAIGSCPLGSLQNMAAAPDSRISLYVLGGLLTAGGTAGRWFCGWLCPFGLIQEITGKLSSYRLKIPVFLTWIKYIILPLVILLPMLWISSDGFGSPYFCQFLCPKGTLTAGIPLVIASPEIRYLIGPVFWVKTGILALIIGASVISHRPFCRTLCPLGVFFGLFNRVALLKLHRDPANCAGCGRCSRSCPMGIELPSGLNSRECIRCFSCIKACPSALIHFGAVSSMKSSKTSLFKNIKKSGGSEG